MPRLITFGGLSVVNGAVINGLANPRSRLAILAVLATAGDRGIRREKLTAMFWPESDEERARTALRQALFALKRDVGGQDITLGVADLRLNPDVLTADVAEFDAAMREKRFTDAAALYTGTFMDGVFVRESPEFERWVEEQRGRLSSAYARALERAASDARQRGDFRAAVDWSEKRAIHDPLSGRVARDYMDALVAAGERERAIRHGASHARLVRQELDAEPDGEVLVLAERLRDANGPSITAETAKPRQSPAEIEPVTDEHAPAARDIRGISARVGVRPSAYAALALLALTGIVALARSVLVKAPPVQPGLVAITDFANHTGDSAWNATARLAASRLVEVLTQSGQGGALDLRIPNANWPVPPRRELESQARRSPAEFLVRAALELHGDSVSLVAQVVDARTGAARMQVEPISVRRDQALLLVDEVRERLGGALVALGDTVFPLWRSGRSRPPRYSAYHEFMQGIDALVNQGMRPAIQHFRKSMKLDSNFAQAKLWYLEQAVAVQAQKERVDSVRSVVLAQRASYVAYDQVAADRQIAFTEGRLEDVYTAARQMVVLAPGVPDARMHLAQASYATRRFQEAIDVLHSVRVAPAWYSDLNQRRAWDLSAHRLLGDLETGIAEWRQIATELPDRVDVCAMGFSLLAAAGLEASVDSLLSACERLPDARPNVDGNLQVAGRNYRMAGHHNAAERAFRRALKIRSALAATGGRHHSGVAALHMDLGEWREAYDVLRTLPADGEARVTLGVAAAYVGDSATAMKTIQWLETQSKREGAEMNRGLIELALGRRDDALESLRAAIASGVSPGWNGWYVRPELTPLRGDPRFEDMIRPVR